MTEYALTNCSFDVVIEDLNRLIVICYHRPPTAIRKMKEILAELALLSEFIDDLRLTV